MRFLSVLAVDDEGPALRRLVKMVQQHPQLILTGTATNAKATKKQVIELQPELLLLDIQLKDATAFDVISELDNFNGKIIFITAYDQYAVKAFEYEAIDYLLKPFTEKRFNSAVKRAVAKDETLDLKKLIEVIKSTSITGLKTVIIPEGAKNYFIEKDELYYIYAEGYYANFVMGKEKKLIRISLKNLEKLLPTNFIRINKSTIINKNFIVELIAHKTTSKVIMPDKNEFYISDIFAEAFGKTLS